MRGIYSEMYGFRIAGSGIVFFPKIGRYCGLLGGFRHVVVRFRQPALHPYHHYQVFFRGGGGQPYFGGGKIKILCFGEGWDSGRAVSEQNCIKMG